MYLAAVDPLDAHCTPCLVYDGQQRLTTITLILNTFTGNQPPRQKPCGVACAPALS